MSTPTAELTRGELVVLGRIMPASNHTFFGELVEDDAAEEHAAEDHAAEDHAAEDHRVRVVYKPTSGERPLWDFTDGTLAAREYAAWVVSDELGWNVVPPTVLRDGPAGWGMVQLWCEPDPALDAVDLVPEGQVPPGFLPVLDAVDGEDRPVSLVHEDSAPLRRMAVFDAVVNNTDRKGGHVLAMTDGHRYGVDHGICFHVEDKLRTVLWGFAGGPLSDEELDGLERISASLRDGRLALELGDLLTGQEVARTRARAERLLRFGCLPVSHGGWPSIPWPPF